MEGLGKYMINEAVRVIEAHSCLLCGNEGDLLYSGQGDRLFGAPGTWNFMRCQKCHFVWLNPRPVSEDIPKLYNKYFTHELTNSVRRFAGLRRTIRNAVLASSLGYNDLAAGALQRTMGKVLCWLGPLKEIVELNVMTLDGQKRGRLLDIGCGNGQFLSKMQKLGWDVVGVEPDGQAVKIAQEHFGVEVYKGTLDEVGLPDNMFDAITMNHVIEHMLDPINTLKECRRVLKNGGKLVIVTPNIESLGHRLFRKAWRGLEVPRHLYLFSPSALRVCAERTGLKVLELRTVARIANWIWITSRLISRKGVLPGGSPQKLSLWLRLEGLVFHVIEYGICKLKDIGEELILIGTK